MKLKQLFLYTVIIAVFSFITVGCSSSSSDKENEKKSNSNKNDSETITLKVTNFLANTAPLSKYGVQPWMERVTELTDGKVQFEYYPGEQLGKAADQYKLVKDGVADIGFTLVNYNSDIFPISNMLSAMPRINKSSLQGTLAYKDLLEESPVLLETDYLKNGVRPLYANVSPAYELWSVKKEIKTPEDLKGLKIRTGGGIENEIFEFVGAAPVSIAFPDLYESTERGIVDAVSLFPVAVNTSGIDEIVKFGTEIFWVTAVYPLIINEKTWDKLPDDVKEAISQANEEVAVQLAKTQDENTKEIVKEISKNATISKLTEDEQQKWDNISEEFQKKWLKDNESKGLPYGEVLNMYKELSKKHE
ncbi:hypothetical protein DCC39_11130 [Pueribacillus theae]|uniref:C4-dicarboxylate ABC transporter n=1 Tax=Pueribacillus theae TaxID=2171751 RepID=A0A2U1JZ15_9BACI|nr:TRAP transporter substrate-binding protein DctP [Pueribacillus theae]PWA10382.1 hypothetical protein DCC39_11130 [Pueribacillus theae]